MNRHLLSRAKFGITEDQRVAPAQSWLLAPPQVRAVAAVNAQTATTQRPILLQGFSAISDQVGGTINANGLRVAGLSLNAGNQTIPIGVFSPTAFGKEHTTVGIAMNQNSTVTVDAVQSAAGVFGYSVGCLPIDAAQVPDSADQADFYNYVVGCGTTGVIAAGGNGQCVATVLRGCWLGLVSCTNQLGTGVIPNSDWVLTDLTVNGISMLAGAANQQIQGDFLVPGGQLGGPAQSSVSDFILDYWVEPNSTIIFSFTNVSGAANMDVGAAIFCKPYKAPPVRGNQFRSQPLTKGKARTKRG